MSLETERDEGLNANEGRAPRSATEIIRASAKINAFLKGLILMGRSCTYIVWPLQLPRGYRYIDAANRLAAPWLGKLSFLGKLHELTVYNMQWTSCSCRVGWSPAM